MGWRRGSPFRHSKGRTVGFDAFTLIRRGIEDLVRSKARRARRSLDRIGLHPCAVRWARDRVATISGSSRVFTNTPQCEVKFLSRRDACLSPVEGPRRWGVASPSSTSRPAEPDASRYPASARIESSFACLESRHRAPLLAEEELGVHEDAGCRRTSRPSAYRKGCGRSPSKTGSGFGHGFTAGLNSRLGARERL